MAKFSFLKIVGLSLLLVSFGTHKPAFAEQWIYVGESDSGNFHLLDFDSIRGSGSTRNFWVRTENSSGRTITLSKLAIDCVSRQGGLLEEIQYSGARVNPYVGYGYDSYPRRVENPYPRMQELVPGTMFSAYADFLCSRITVTPEPTSFERSSSSSSVRAACGDPSPNTENSYRLYPVFVNYSQNTLQSIRTDLCQDAFRMRRENGQDAIQVASFTSESRAREFAQGLRNRFGSGEVGQPNTISRP